MSIRLNKITRDLNVGIQTVVDFLHKKGFDVEVNPNTKISEEQHELLLKEFSKDMDLKLASEKISNERYQKIKHTEEQVIVPPKEEVKEAPKPAPAPTPAPVAETIIEAPAAPQFKTVGKIDLDALNKRTSKPAAAKAKPAPPVEKPVEKPIEKPAEKPVEKEIPQPKAVVEEPAPTPKEETPVPAKAPHIEPTPAPVVEVIKKEEKEEKAPQAISTEPNSAEIFSLNTNKIENTINVIGKIDLSALNQQTRPKKKSKEEKRVEREGKDKERNDQRASANAARIATNELERKKRNRIKKEKVDIVASASTAARPTLPPRNNNRPIPRPVRAEVNDEDVQKQIKETLARLTNKGGQKKGTKWRKEKREAASSRQQEQAEQARAEDTILKLTEFVTASDLANMMNVPINNVIGTCMNIGMMVSINQRLDAETINIVAEEFGFKTQYVSAEVVESITNAEDNPEDLSARTPIVTVMGHVDHGKTSLLDYIRSANVIAGEAGGITQHIGAYNVTLPDGRHITFLDTPGHEAFTAMRARGAKVTDIAIIIIAADDSIMPQTVEAINHASAAGVPIVFAINKVDKPNANPEKIKEGLSQLNYLVEDWGGKYQSQEVSAKKGTGIPELLEKVLLEAELLDLKANANRNAVGSVIESTLDKGRGYVSTVLVSNGTLKIGDIIVAGTQYGRVKAMFNERNQRIKEAGPAEPALVLGLNGAPTAGDLFNVLDSDQEAREIATKREQLQRELGLRTQKHLTLDDIGRRIAIGNFQELNVIVKGDVDGSIEAIADSLIKLSTEEIQVNVIHKAVGQISESDVTLAAASNAIIIGFQVRPSLAARRLAEREEVDIRLYSIIYDAIEEVKAAMEGMLSPEIREEITATVEVHEVFKITKVGTVAGCIVKEGKIKRNNKIRLIRDGIVIYQGALGSLKRFKDDVKEVATGYECGLNIEKYNDIRTGDMIESYEEVEVKKTL